MKHPPGSRSSNSGVHIVSSSPGYIDSRTSGVHVITGVNSHPRYINHGRVNHTDTVDFSNSRVIKSFSKGAYYHSDSNLNKHSVQSDTNTMPQQKNKKKSKVQAGSAHPSGAYTLGRDGQMTSYPTGQTVYKMHAVPGDKRAGKRYMLEEVTQAARVHQWVHNQGNNPRSQKTHLAPGGNMIASQTGHVKVATRDNHGNKHHGNQAYSHLSSNHGNNGYVNIHHTNNHHGDRSTNRVVNHHESHQSVANTQSVRQGTPVPTGGVAVDTHTRGRAVHTQPEVRAHVVTSATHKEDTAVIHSEPPPRANHVTTSHNHVTSNGHPSGAPSDRITSDVRVRETYTTDKNMNNINTYSTNTHRAITSQPIASEYYATANNYHTMGDMRTRGMRSERYDNGGINTLTLLDRAPPRRTTTPSDTARTTTPSDARHIATSSDAADQPSTSHDVTTRRSHDVTTPSRTRVQNVKSDPTDEKTYLRWSPSMRRKEVGDVIDRAPSQSSYIIASSTLPPGSHIPVISTLPSARSRTTSRYSTTLPVSV